jgi:hypothetical protein
LLEYVRVREVLDIGVREKIEDELDLEVTMTDGDIIMRFKDFFNCGSVTESWPYRQEHHKQCWTWGVGGLDALRVLEQMLPFFGKRRTE